MDHQAKSPSRCAPEEDTVSSVHRAGVRFGYQKRVSTPATMIDGLSLASYGQYRCTGTVVRGSSDSRMRDRIGAPFFTVVRDTVAAAAAAAVLPSPTMVHLCTRAMFRYSSRVNSFGATHLGLRLPEDGGSVTFNHVAVDDKCISLSFAWPQWLGRPDGQLCMASALAVCDEASTFGMAALDPEHRPGVSVTLSGQRTSNAQIEPESSVTIRSRVMKKPGRSLYARLKTLASPAAKGCALRPASLMMMPPMCQQGVDAF